MELESNFTDQPGRVDRRRFLAGGAALGGLAALSMIGCSSDSSSGSGAEPTGSSAGGKPRRGGSMRVGTGGAVPPDYTVGSSFSDGMESMIQMAWPLFLPTLGFDIVNGLANSYKVSPDGLTHTIGLRPNLVFQDGSPIDAKAVGECLSSQLFEDSPLRDRGTYSQADTFGSPTIVSSVKPSDEQTITIVLKTPRIDISRTLRNFPIVNPTILERKNYGTDVAAMQAMGSGPFRITKFEPSTYAEFERFDDFFEPPYLDRIRYDTMADQSAIGLALRGGEIDAALGLSAADYNQLSQDEQFKSLVSKPSSNLFLSLQSVTKGLLQDPKVREAIWLALNREAYAQAFFAKGASATGSQTIIVPGVGGFDPALEVKPHDPERAKQLIDEAGAAGGTLTLISADNNGGYSLKPLVEAIADDLGKVGLQVKSRVTDLETYVADRLTTDAAVYRYGSDVDPLVNPTYYFGAFQPPDPRASKTVKQYLEAAQTATSSDSQNQSLRELYAYEHNDLVTTIPIAFLSRTALVRTAIQDFRLSALEYDPQYRTWLAD